MNSKLKLKYRSVIASFKHGPGGNSWANKARVGPGVVTVPMDWSRDHQEYLKNNPKACGGV